MKIKYFAYIRDYTGCKEEDFKYCKTVEKLLVEICDKYGSKFRSKVFKDDKLSDEIIILVNGRHITHLNELKTKLEHKDKISIFPVVAGG